MTPNQAKLLEDRYITLWQAEQQLFRFAHSSQRAEELPLAHARTRESILRELGIDADNLEAIVSFERALCLSSI